jgi:hypothetical protein
MMMLEALVRAPNDPLDVQRWRMTRTPAWLSNSYTHRVLL